MFRRAARLVVGLVLFGGGVWLGLVAELGVGPWSVLTGGLSEHLHVPFGTMSIAVSALVLLVGTALSARPGIGTVLDVVVIGGTIDVLLALGWLDGLGERAVGVRLLATAGGIAAVAAGSALYLGAHLGPGPRDGLMVAMVQRTGWPVGRCRALLECGVLVLGIALGGPVGLGTLAFALGIGPAVQVAFRVFGQPPVRRPSPRVPECPDQKPTATDRPHLTAREVLSRHPRRAAPRLGWVGGRCTLGGRPAHVSVCQASGPRAGGSSFRRVQVCTLGLRRCPCCRSDPRVAPRARRGTAHQLWWISVVTHALWWR